MDVSESNFTAAVIDRSHQLPVVVDFWAEWCGPCRQLGPVLERAVAARAGQLELVKVDVDANPRLSQSFDIKGIPAVKAFRDGRVVSEFVGAQPPAAIDRFLDALLPDPVDDLVARGDEPSLREALRQQPNRADAALPLARILLNRRETDAARELLRNVSSFQADGLLARLELQTDADPQLAEAFAALDQSQTEHALDLLLEALPSADGRRDDIRRVIVGVLDELGVESPLARAARRRLAAALY